MTSRYLTMLGAMLLLMAPGSQAEESTLSQEALLNQLAQTLVPVEVVLESRYSYGGQGDKQESRMDIMGTVVDPSGLILISNSSISASRFKQISAVYGRDQQFDFEITPRSFEVLLPGAVERVPAVLVASDSTLDLAFLLLEKPPEDLVALDFSRAPEQTIGTPVVSLSRLGGGFDFAPNLHYSRVSGQLKKPLPAWILDPRLTQLGMVVFDLQGRPLGVLTTVFSAASADVDGSPMFSMMGSLGGGQNEMGPVGVFLLPAERLARLVTQAKEQAARLAEE